ncbi:unnamed protein product [Allacma fusca]|uniref:Uncharacterized protein n=1 Tax=Allacma fusca TaxID=39272 RepID=A0A8J2P4V6_9HEXA|nr:unnamed protein product [Allacma fusca]
MGNGSGNHPPGEKPETVTVALVAIVVLGTALVLILLLCYACVLRRLCCPDFGRSKSHHHATRSTTTQHTSCDITRLDTLTTERSPS